MEMAPLLSRSRRGNIHEINALLRANKLRHDSGSICARSPWINKILLRLALGGLTLNFFVFCGSFVVIVETE